MKKSKQYQECVKMSLTMHFCLIFLKIFPDCWRDNLSFTTTFSHKDSRIENRYSCIEF